MSKSPAFRWYPKDILGSQRVAIMTLSEEGAYRRALDFCWLQGYLPRDVKSLMRLIGKGCNSKTAKIVADMFLVHPDDETKLIHERLDIERVKQTEYSKKSSLGGLKSAEKRRTKVQPKFNDPCNQNSTTLEEPLVPKSNISFSFASTYPKEDIINIITTDEIEKIKIEILESRMYLEMVAMKWKLSVEKVKEDIEFFFKEKKELEQLPNDLKKAKQHIFNWIRLHNLKEKNFPQKKENEGTRLQETMKAAEAVEQIDWEVHIKGNNHE